MVKTLEFASMVLPALSLSAITELK